MVSSPGNLQFSYTPLGLCLASVPDPDLCRKFPLTPWLVAVTHEAFLKSRVCAFLCHVLSIWNLWALVKRSSRHKSRIPIVVAKVLNTSANVIFQFFCPNGVTHTKNIFLRVVASGCNAAKVKEWSWFEYLLRSIWINSGRQNNCSSYFFGFIFPEQSNVIILNLCLFEWAELWWFSSCLGSLWCSSHGHESPSVWFLRFFFVRQPSWLLQHAARLRLFYTLMMAARCWVHSGGDTHQTRLVRWKLLLKYQQKQTVGLKPPFFPCLFFF